jgi:hypothetical protein
MRLLNKFRVGNKEGLVPGVYLQKCYFTTGIDLTKPMDSNEPSHTFDSEPVVRHRPPSNEYICENQTFPVMSLSTSSLCSVAEEMIKSDCAASSQFSFDREPDVYYAIDDYEDTFGSSVNLKRGQALNVLNRESVNGWCFVRFDDGLEGWTPSAFLQKEMVRPARPPRPISVKTEPINERELKSNKKTEITQTANKIDHKSDDLNIFNSSPISKNKVTNTQNVEMIKSEASEIDTSNEEYKPIKVSELRKRFQGF